MMFLEKIFVLFGPELFTNNTCYLKFNEYPIRIVPIAFMKIYEH